MPTCMKSTSSPLIKMKEIEKDVFMPIAPNDVQ
jgi:hypothetical protein